jgi:hypothetical protein
VTIDEVLRQPGPGVPGDCYPGLPPVRRARGYRLYTDGGRVLDFWQAGGGAFLGHSPSGLGKALKAEIDRGLLATLPGWGGEKLKAAMRALLPGWVFTPYADLSRALTAVSRIAGVPSPGIDDPALILPASGLPAAGAALAFWRPGLETAAPAQAYLLPVLPGMHGTAAVLLGVPVAGDGAPDYGPTSYGPPGYGPLGAGDSLSPIDFTLLTHGALLLSRAYPDRSQSLEAAPPKPRRKPPANEISLRSAGGKELLAPLWGRRGAYLTPRCAKGDYGAMFNTYLKNDFYIAPRYPGPSILPAHCSPGEWARFLEVTQTIAEALPL